MANEPGIQKVRLPRSLREFHRDAREALELYRELQAIDAEERAAKAAATEAAEAKRRRAQPKYERRMSRMMAYVRHHHPEVLKSGDVSEFETDELIVRLNKDKNGKLEVLSEAAMVAYLERRPELRDLVKVTKTLGNKTKFKQWWRSNPNRRPPAHITYGDTVSFIRKSSRGITKSEVLKREVIDER